MEQKINVETLASSLVDGYMDAEDLKKKLYPLNVIMYGRGWQFQMKICAPKN